MVTRQQYEGSNRPPAVTAEFNRLPGYPTLTHAIMEFIDNSEEHGARNIGINFDANSLYVSDDGKGMNSLGHEKMWQFEQWLHAAWQTGLYGQGTKAAINHLGPWTRAFVITKINNQFFASRHHHGDWCCVFDLSEQRMRTIWNEFHVNPNSATGTMVCVNDMFEEVNRREIINLLSYTYFNIFPKKEISLFVDGKEVEVKTPIGTVSLRGWPVKKEYNFHGLTFSLSVYKPRAGFPRGIIIRNGRVVCVDHPFGLKYAKHTNAAALGWCIEIKGDNSVIRKWDKILKIQSTKCVAQDQKFASAFVEFLSKKTSLLKILKENCAPRPKGVAKQEYSKSFLNKCARKLSACGTKTLGEVSFVASNKKDRKSNTKPKTTSKSSGGRSCPVHIEHVQLGESKRAFDFYLNDKGETVIEINVSRLFIKVMDTAALEKYIYDEVIDNAALWLHKSEIEDQEKYEGCQEKLESYRAGGHAEKASLTNEKIIDVLQNMPEDVVIPLQQIVEAFCSSYPFVERAKGQVQVKAELHTRIFCEPGWRDNHLCWAHFTLNNKDKTIAFS